MIDLKIGVIGIPGKWSTEVLADRLEARIGFRQVMDMNQMTLDCTTGTLQYQGQSIHSLDGIIVKKISAEYSPNTLDRLRLLQVAEQSGVRIFSPVPSMLGLVNRLDCTLTLRRAGIPMPDTLLTESVDDAVAAVKAFGSVVFKPLFSTKARGMLMLEATQGEAAIRAAVEAFRSQNAMMYLQKKVNLPGRDMGMVFLAGEYLGTYARVSQGNTWNTTIHSGGRYEACDPEPTLIELARRAQAEFHLDFTTVDIAETDSGPIVFEVSAFGGFKGALEGAGIDAADRYAAHAIAELSK